MEEKLGVIVYDGKIIDLDNMPIEKLKEYQKEIAKKQKELKKEINDVLDNDNPSDEE